MLFLFITLLSDNNMQTNKQNIAFFLWRKGVRTLRAQCAKYACLPPTLRLQGFCFDVGLALGMRVKKLYVQAYLTPST